MSEIELHITCEDDGGDVWIEIEDCVIRNAEDGRGTAFTILDYKAADLLVTLLKIRRPGTYRFGPADVNG